MPLPRAIVKWKKEKYPLNAEICQKENADRAIAYARYRSVSYRSEMNKQSGGNPPKKQRLKFEGAVVVGKPPYEKETRRRG